jgi:hypothetical protein
MGRLSGILVAGALVLMPPFSQGHAGAQETAQQPQQQQQQQAPKLTFEGDTALWTIAIRPDKTADFEQIIAKLFAGLAKSTDATRQQQAQGWKIMRLEKPLPDGNIAYVHIINPVVPGADYTVMQALYDLYPEERLALYELYRGAFAANLSLAVGNMVKPAAPMGQ